MTVAKYVQPNFLTQDHTTYKGSIDAACAVFARHSGWFAPHAQDTPVMTVRIDAGYIWDGVTLTEVAAQSTGTITAPVGNPRIDRVVVDAASGAVSVITGTPAGSPSAPAITAGKIPVAKISLLTSSTTITNSMITDERALTTTPPAAFSINGLTQDSNPDGTADYLPTYDASASGQKKVLLHDLLKIVSGLTADTSPDVTADYLLSYDASASAPKKLLHSDFFKGVNGLTADTSGDPAADYLLLYKTSASAPRKILPNNLGISSSTKINAQSSTYTLLAADRGKLVSFTGSSDVTWAFTAATTLGDGWWCYLSNDGTSEATVTLDPNSTEQIDGMTSYKMYPGEVRIVQCTGSAFNSRVLQGYTVTFNATGTWYKAPGYKSHSFEITDGGGAGASRTTTGSAGGGAGGAKAFMTLLASLLASTETMTVAAAAAGVSGNTAGTNGNQSSITINGVTTTISTTTARGGGTIGLSTGTTTAAGGILKAGLIGLNGAAGGTVPANDVVTAGSDGLNAPSGGGSVSTNASASAQNGGTSFDGTGGASGAKTGASNGTAGTANSGCGGGAAVQGGTSGQGAAGKIIVRGVV